MDVSAAVTAIGDAVTPVQTIGVAIFGVAAAVLAVRFVRKVMGA